VWATAFGLLGYLFGRNLERLQNLVGDASWALAMAVVVIVVALWIWRRRREAKLANRATPNENSGGTT
jgi:membrane protein DedA with SNARE-associated domain